jgi:dihydropteroate synthase
VTPVTPQGKPVIVGILNVTPDSFSDGSNFFSLDGDVNKAVARAEEMVQQGADIIDVGGESTRPGAQPVSASEEIARVVPVIKEIYERIPNVRISIDTTKSSVAEEALKSGTKIVNDVSAFRLDREMAAVCARAGCQVILMHSRGDVNTMASYDLANYSSDPVADVIAELNERIQQALSAGIAHDKIIVDPGFGFSKRTEHSIAIINQIDRLQQLGFPILVGASRKRFVGDITNAAAPVDRDAGTIAINVIAFMRGATYFRVHDVLGNRRALDAAYALLSA